MMLGPNQIPTPGVSDDSPLSFPKPTSGDVPRSSKHERSAPDYVRVGSLSLLHQLPNHDQAPLTTAETTCDFNPQRGLLLLSRGMLLECIAKVSQNETEDRGVNENSWYEKHNSVEPKARANGPLWA